MYSNIETEFEYSPNEMKLCSIKVYEVSQGSKCTKIGFASVLLRMINEDVYFKRTQLLKRSMSKNRIGTYIALKLIETVNKDDMFKLKINILGKKGTCSICDKNIRIGCLAILKNL